MGKEYDPRMHGAEHVMNQTMVRMFGCGRSFSSHLNPGKSKCDYHFSRDLTDAEANELETRVNEQLARNLPITTEMVNRDVAAKLADISRLPAQTDSQEQLRIVRVGDYDICACIGEHVENTSEIGAFKLVSHSFTPGEKEGAGVLRLRFKLD